MTCPTFSDRDAALREQMMGPRVTMHDEYGRCIHCGFWHKPGTWAEQACAEHEEHYRNSPRGICACWTKKLPVPHRTADGGWSVDPATKPMGPPTASQHLRESMRRETDPRWDLMPVEPVKAPRRRLGWAALGFAIGFPIGVLIEIVERIMT